MSKETKHTPLPWRRDGLTDISGTARFTGVVASVKWRQLRCVEPYSIDDESDANAEFIVQACNAHYNLLAACEAAEKWLDEFGANAPHAFGGEVEIYQQLRAAIAQAKGEAD